MRVKKLTLNRNILNLKNTLRLMGIFLFGLLSNAALVAQCSLTPSCHDTIQVSLDGNCMAEITAAMMLSNEQSAENAGCTYSLVIRDPSNNGAIVPNPVGPAYIGKVLEVTVEAMNGGSSNTCWGNLLIEDKNPTFIDCPDDLTIGCNESFTVDDAEDLISLDDNCSTTPEIVFLDSSIVDMACNGNFRAIKTYRFQASDGYNLSDDICEINVYLENRNNSDIMFPLNWDGLTGNNPVLYCTGDYDNAGTLTEWDTNEDGYPNPEETGYPMLDGEPLHGNTNYCKIQVTYTDDTLEICGLQNFKIIRNWVALDWCSPSTDDDNPSYGYQIIKVTPYETTEVCTQQDTTISMTASYDCYTGFEYTPDIPFACNASGVTIRAGYLYGTGDDNCGVPANMSPSAFTYLNESKGVGEKFTFPSVLQVGCNWVIFEATDECGTNQRCIFKVTVEENVPPQVVCDEHTHVSLSSLNEGKIWAKTFDDGSFDNCTEDLTYEVARMEGTDCESNTRSFGPFLKFCCQDVDKTVLVILRVTDDSGNSATCMVEADVTGETGASFSEEARDTTIACSRYNPALFGTLGQFVLETNCGLVANTVVTIRPNLNSCGEGHYAQIWQFLASDGTLIASAQNRIYIENTTPFTMPDRNWPADYSFELGEGECIDDMLDPDNAGRPNITHAGDCSLVSATYQTPEEVFEFVEGACIKIVRKWIVIDWCQYDEDLPSNENNPGLWTYTQIIKSVDKFGPKFIPECHEVIVLDTLGSTCLTTVTLRAALEDDASNCSSNDGVVFTHKVDYNNNGSIDVSERTGQFFDRNDVPFGTHRIYWTARDRCGNISRCDTTFVVRESKDPTPYCLSGVTTVVMPVEDFVDIWAEDFDRGSFDNCLDSPLKFTMRREGSSEVPTDSLTLTCNDIPLGQNSVMIDVEIHVTDQFGNSDFCIATLTLQANNGSCNTNSANDMDIQGLIVATGNNEVEDVMVKLEDMVDHNERNYMTQTDGKYSFSDLSSTKEYHISASKQDIANNGVSTVDMIMIQRHILGIKLFESAYDIIAADANNNQIISASDLVAIRKVILGIYQDFPNNESWRFVDASQEFFDVHSPWPLQEDVFVKDMTESTTQNFKAIKVGDVNGDAKVNKAIDTEHRYDASIDLVTDDRYFEKGDLFDISLSIKEAAYILGYQAAFSYNNQAIEISSVSSILEKFNEDNVFINNDLGSVKLSWDAIEEVSLDEYDELISFQVRALANGRLSEVWNLSESFQNEIYDTHLESSKLSLRIGNENASNSTFELFQNNPNPFNRSTSIGFNLPTEGKVNFQLMDVTGRVIMFETKTYTAGYNEINLNHSAISNPGVLYYQIEYNGLRLSKKMIKVD